MLCARFDQTLAKPCGACSSYAGVPVEYRTVSPVEQTTGLEKPETWCPGVPARIRVELAELGTRGQQALGHPRHKARFLAGRGNPALTKACLGKHPLFGGLSQMPFRVPSEDLEKDCRPGDTITGCRLLAR